jgi:two-component system sensor histidine kinase KdpD
VPRFASHLDASWTAVYVETPRLQRLPVHERGRILNVVKLAEELGAKTAILTGETVREAIVDYANEHNIATVIVGRGPARRLPWMRSLSERIASTDESLDVIEIGRGGADAGNPVEAPAMKPADTEGSRVAEKRFRYFWTVVASAVTTAVASALYPSFELVTIAMLFMLTVVLRGAIRARSRGRGAVLNVAAFDFFFVPPRFELRAHRPQHYLTFAVMVAVGRLIGQLAGHLRFQARRVASRERARTLYEFARPRDVRTTSQVIEKPRNSCRASSVARRGAGARCHRHAGIAHGRGMTNPFDSTRRSGLTTRRSRRARAPTRSRATSTCSFR